jgi:Putative zinc-finger
VSVRDLVSLSCKEIVELVTEYHCDALDSADRVKFEQHLFGCTWCMTYLKQADRAIELTAQLRRPVEPEAVDTGKLATLFRSWREGQGGKGK